METALHVVATVLVIPLMLAYYFAPTLVAFRRKRKDKESIIVMNVLFGWFPLLWLVVLITAFRGETTAPKDARLFRPILPAEPLQPIN